MSLELIDSLLHQFNKARHKHIERRETSKNEDTQEKCVKLLSQTLDAKSKICLMNTSNIKRELPAKNDETKITAKLRLTTKYIQIYYPQPIHFDSSSTEQSRGSRLASDMAFKTMADEILFSTDLDKISSHVIDINKKSDNVSIKCLDSTECTFTLSKWSAKSLNESLDKLL